MKNSPTILKNLHLPQLLQWLFLFILCLLFSSCASMDTGYDKMNTSVKKASKAVDEALFPSEGRMDFDLSQGIRIYNNAKIYVSNLQVNVAANRALEAKPTALFVPFGLVQTSLDHYGISYGVSRILWQQFLAEQTFSILEFSEVSPPYRVEHAIQGAKALGAQFLVGGYITHFIDGASVGDSKLALQLEIYDTNTGSLLWAINQSGVLPYKTDKNNALFTIHNRMPIDAMSTLVSALGADLAKYLHYWTDPKAMGVGEIAPETLLEKIEPSAFGKY